MADQSEAERETSNIEILQCQTEPRLEGSQDLELLAREIAEAVVEEERKVPRTPSPTSSTSSPSPSPSYSFEKTEDCACTSDDDEMDEERETDEETDEDPEEHTDNDNNDVDLLESDDELMTLDHREETTESLQQRPITPDDEASWVLVDATEDSKSGSTDQKKFSVFRKFLARGDLKRKLSELGFACDDIVPQNAGKKEEEKEKENQLENLMMSCSESIVICHLPEEGDEEGMREGSISQVTTTTNTTTTTTTTTTTATTTRENPDEPKNPSWRGSVAGGTVAVEVERQGGLLVAAVTVTHRDLLSALTSLRNLVSSAGLVSYADVDVPSLLARAA